MDVLTAGHLHQLPGFPAIAAMARAVYLKTYPDVFRLHRIDSYSGESRRTDSLALRCDFYRPLLPSPTTVLRTKKHRRRWRAGSDEHVVRVHRINPDRPDIIGIER